MADTQIRLDVQTDIARALRDLAWLRPEEMANIVAHGLNRTMRTIRAEEKRNMEQVFDNPTRFTLNSFFTVPATPHHLAVEIRLKNDGSRGIPAAKYLFPEVYGGSRRFKGFEVALQAMSVLPSGMYAMPAGDAPLDAFGNISGGFLRRILSKLRQAGQEANNPTGRTRRRSATTRQVFASDGSRGLPAGIYERQGRTLKILIKFVDKQPHYEKRFNFHEVAERVAQRFLVNDIRELAVRANDRNRASTRSELSRSISDLLRGN
jgi:hypothetical protein